MKKILFLDTETTGNDPGLDRLTQVCFKTDDNFMSAYFKPPIPISVKAMSVTHITNKMVSTSESFGQSEFRTKLINLLEESIMVAHNAPFDIAILKNEGVEVYDFIDTLRVARFLDKEGIIPEYNLQFLRYFLAIDVEAPPHDAKGDVIVLEALFERLFNKIRENHHNDENALEEMIEISRKPSLMVHFTFGKHKGRKVAEVAQMDRPYLEWLLNQKLQNEEGEVDWIFTLKSFLN